MHELNRIDGIIKLDDLICSIERQVMLWSDNHDENPESKKDLIKLVKSYYLMGRYESHLPLKD